MIPTRTGVLLTNIGSPRSCNVSAVREYLRKFLNDPRIIKLPSWLRWLVLEGFILRVRPKKSWHAYKKIWTPKGSPLAIITALQAEKLQTFLRKQVIPLHNDVENNSIYVTYGMSYGEPSIADGLNILIKEYRCHQLIILPLYPQYSGSTTASTFDFIAQYMQKQEFIPSIQFINGYADHPAYISAWAEHLHAHRAGREDWHLLLSFHGIPKEYVEAGDPYPFQCKESARLIAEKMGLAEHQWSLSFQSRLGPREWLKPYTDVVLKNFPSQNIKNVLVACPGFAADCLETLEEVAMQNRDFFMAAGGQNYFFIPGLNDKSSHIEALARVASRVLLQSPRTNEDNL